jgi:hypothetical protein
MGVELLVAELGGVSGVLFLVWLLGVLMGGIGGFIIGRLV